MNEMVDCSFCILEEDMSEEHYRERATSMVNEGKLKLLMKEISLGDVLAEQSATARESVENEDAVIMIPMGNLPIDVTGEMTRQELACSIPSTDRQTKLALTTSDNPNPLHHEHSISSQGVLLDKMTSPNVHFDETTKMNSIVTTNFLRFRVENPEFGYAQLLLTHTCYDVIPSSTKMVVFDHTLPVKKAFYGLLFNCTRAALITGEDSKLKGILSVTDLITVLLHFFDLNKSGKELGEDHMKLEDHTIESWRDLLGSKRPHKPLIAIPANASLYLAAQCLSDNKVHRVPVLDPDSGDPMYFITHKRLLKFLWVFGKNLPHASFLDKTPRESNLGVWGDDVVTAFPDDNLCDVLRTLVTKNLSGIPIVTRYNASRPDLSRIVIDIYSRFDVINLAASGNMMDLEIPVEAALAYRALDKNVFGGVVSCSEKAPLREVLATLVERSVHRIMVVDQRNSLKGLISLSDILRFLVTSKKVRDIVASTNAAVREIKEEMEIAEGEYYTKM